MNRSFQAALFLAALHAGVVSLPQEERPPERLPEGPTGIASRYPGDAGIEKDPAVLLYDGFETCARPADLGRRWDVWYHDPHLRFTEERDHVYGGRKALEFTVPRQDQELSNTVAKRLKEERDVLFLRFYAQFDRGFDQVGSSHNGATIAAHYHIQGRATPGIPADGRNKFLASLECWRGEEATPSPGNLNVYVYHPAQLDRYGDHFFPSGLILPRGSRPGDLFGRGFVRRPEVVPELGRWHCYEFMVRANTPGRRDGRIACWLDGRLVADFPGLRLRDVDSLKIDYFSLDLHIRQNSRRENRKWYDDVVAAGAYIGPQRPARPR